MTTPHKTRMKVFNRGHMREINCFQFERDYMAKLARCLRKWHKQYKEAKPTLITLRIRAAERYL